MGVGRSPLAVLGASLSPGLIPWLLSMSYEPLHHKYRPQTFAQLVGQEAIAKTLSNALYQQRIAPAYLFCGPRGTGKTSSARILAKSLNCISSPVPTADPCGHCETCTAITRGAALDVIEIDAASNTGVDNIRELIERAQFAPVQCRFKVYVIDECHMLSTAAFNALLKTLEEPPERVVFVLATTDPQRVLPTIISRCQRFDFRRIPLEAMTQHLQAIAQAEQIAIQPPAVQLIAQIAQGGLRDAESLLDQLSLVEGEVGVEQVWDLVGAVPERELLDLLKAIAADNGVAVLDHARHLMNRGREPLIVLQSLASTYRDLLIAKTAPTRQDLVAITPSTWSEMCAFAQHLDLAVILAGQQHLRSAEVQVKNTTQPRLWLEVTLMGLLPSALVPLAPKVPSVTAALNVPSVPSIPAPANVPTVTAIPPVSTVPEPSAQSRTAALPETPVSPGSDAKSPPPAIAAPAPVPTAPAPTVAPAAALHDPVPQPDVQQNLADMWQDILALVEPFSTRMMLRQQCSLGAFNGTEARIVAKSQPLFRMAKERLPNLEVALQAYFRRPIQVKLEVAAEAAATETPPAPPMPSQGSQTPRPQPNDGSDRPQMSPQTTRKATPQARAESPTPAAPEPSPPDGSPLPAVPPSEPQGQPDPILSNDWAYEPPMYGSQAWQPEDEVTRAAKFLAETFNGQIVGTDAPDVGNASQNSSGEFSAPAIAPDDDDDVPF